MATSIKAEVADQLQRLEHVIEELSDELASSRLAARKLSSERDRMQEQLVHAELAEVGRQDTQARWEGAQHEHRRLEKMVVDLETENSQLSIRIAQLERGLAESRLNLESAPLEIGCLQEQVTQLRAIVELLMAEKRGA